MKIETTRFGSIEVDEDKIITFTKGILGFPDDKRYALLPHKKNSPFLWLQSIDSPDLAFVVMDPGFIKSDYTFEIPDEIEKELKINTPEEVDTLVIITIRSDSNGKKIKMSANLLGPIVINVEKRLAAQIVLDPKKFPVRYEFN